MNITYVTLMAGLALLVGSTTTYAGGATPSRSPRSQMLAFSRCMRSHGVQHFPNPNSKGQLPKAQVDHLQATDPQFVPAHRACSHLLPNGGQPTGAQVRQAWRDMRHFARCMRSHGVPRWPDPHFTSKQDHRPFFFTEEAGINPNSPRVQATTHTCRHLLHTSNALETLQ